MVIKMILITIFCIGFSIQSCTIQNDKKNEVFSEVLTKEILDYMSLTEKKGHSKYIYYLWGDSIDDSQYIFLGYGLCYEMDRICCYTFLNDKLIVFNKDHQEFPFKGWINSDPLVKFKNSIPNSNYQECSSIENFPDFDPKIRQLKIVSQDSLYVVNTSMRQYQLFLDDKVKYLQEFGREKELEELYKKVPLYTMPAAQSVQFVPPKLK